MKCIASCPPSERVHPPPPCVCHSRDTAGPVLQPYGLELATMLWINWNIIRVSTATPTTASGQPARSSTLLMISSRVASWSPGSSASPSPRWLRSSRCRANEQAVILWVWFLYEYRNLYCLLDKRHFAGIKSCVRVTIVAL